MSETLQDGVGLGAKNLPQDVRTVRRLLDHVGIKPGFWGSVRRKLEHYARDMSVDDELRKIGVGVSADRNAGLITDIVRFQKLLDIKTKAGKYDGRVDPRGTTLKKLNWIASPLTLRPIKSGASGKRIEDGGYKVSVDPATPLPPKPWRVWLGRKVGSDFDGVEVTGRPRDDLIDEKRLVELLKIIERAKQWGSQLPMQLFVTFGDDIVSTSHHQLLACPVQPHNGKLLPLDAGGNGPTLTYQGDAAAESFYGRWLVKLAGYDKYVFGYLFDSKTGKSKFETDRNHRGFDCTTYAGSVCGLDPRFMCSSAKVAEGAGVDSCSVVDPTTKKTVVLDKADPKYAKQFFETKPNGYYLMWSSGHIVVVADGTVHEFSAGKNGYGDGGTDVVEWLKPYNKTKLTVRKLRSRPARAS